MLAGGASRPGASPRRSAFLFAALAVEFAAFRRGQEILL
jgi:hypothetical protein